jgi:hypothetical protein
MKTIKSLPRLNRGKILVSLLFLLTSGCSDPTRDVLPSPDPEANSDIGDWVATLDELFYDAGIIVQKDGSIQDAVNAARPGEVIYIEPGNYPEMVTIDKSGIKLIGLENGLGEEVVIGNPGMGRSAIQIPGNAVDTEIINIQDNSSTDTDVRSSANAKKNKKSCKVTRHKVNSTIAHYQFEVRIGDRPYDVVRIHRVVRETKPYHPVRTRGAVFLLHGASLNFESIFLKGGTENPDAATSVSYYLASKGIDVWGMDFAWTLVPNEETDFSFMKDWGVERDMDHALAAMSIARLIRGLTGQGLGRMNLLGYSYGVGVAYGAAGRETQEHPILRDIKGIIAVDQLMKYEEALENEGLRQTACATAQALKASIEGGTYQAVQGRTLALVGGLALSDPNGMSPLPPFSGLTNYQTALAIGTSEVAGPLAPGWHFVSGKFEDVNPFPIGLEDSDPTRWNRLLSSLPPYQPQKTVYDVRACMCDEEDVTFDDYLCQISVPILYLGAEGAFGSYGHYTSSLTSSQDITNHTISLRTPRVLDFGHGDLILADDAPGLVWEPLRQWLADHSYNNYR